MIKNRIKPLLHHSEAIFDCIQSRIAVRIFLYSVVLLVLSCNETKEVGPENLGYDYYPIELGQYRIYEVEEINYKLIGFDTSHYQLRETIIDSIKSEDQTNYLIRRDKRDTAIDEWETDSVWTFTQTDRYLAITENNVPFIKLTFPVSSGKEWDGNSLNSKSERFYYYQAMDSTIVDSIAQDDHIRMIIEDIPRNVVNQDERSEVYIKGLGLVHKYYTTLQFCTTNCDELGQILSGRFLDQLLIEAGNE